MRIDELYTSGEPVFSFEFFPPRSEEGERHLRDALAELAALDPAYVSVTYGAGGSTHEKTMDVVTDIKRRHRLEAMPHFTCVGATERELRDTLDRMRDAGIENVLALRGDPPAGQAKWTKTEGGLEHSHELVELIRSDYPFAIGAACFPETHIDATSPEEDLRYLKQKVDAGATFLITQLFFDNAYYFEFVERARGAGIEVPIIPGIMPIVSVAQIKRITQLCGSDIPPPLRRELQARADDDDAEQAFGIAYATLQCADLLANGAPGIHFYTLNRGHATRAILSALRVMRPWRVASSGSTVVPA